MIRKILIASGKGHDAKRITEELTHRLHPSKSEEIPDSLHLAMITTDLFSLVRYLDLTDYLVIISSVFMAHLFYLFSFSQWCLRTSCVVCFSVGQCIRASFLLCKLELEALDGGAMDVRTLELGLDANIKIDIQQKAITHKYIRELVDRFFPTECARGSILNRS